MHGNIVYYYFCYKAFHNFVLIPPVYFLAPFSGKQIYIYTLTQEKWPIAFNLSPRSSSTLWRLLSDLLYYDLIKYKCDNMVLQVPNKNRLNMHERKSHHSRIVLMLLKWEQKSYGGGKTVFRWEKLPRWWNRAHVRSEELRGW